jgi:hypothetical protein
MALKAITLRLDEEEYEQLKEHLSNFGDPDINVAFVIRSYIRDLNRVLPYVMNAGWDLKNYFGLMGVWLKQLVDMTDGILSKGMFNWWQQLQPSEISRGRDEETEKSEEESPSQSKGKRKKRKK